MIFKDWRLIMAAYDDQAKALDNSPGAKAPSAAQHRKLTERARDGGLFREL